MNESVRLEDLETKEQVEEKLIYPLEYLDYPKYELTDDEFKKVSHGMQINTSKEFTNGTVILTKNNQLSAVAKNNDGTIKCEKVFI